MNIIIDIPYVFTFLTSSLALPMFHASVAWFVHLSEDRVGVRPGDARNFLVLGAGLPPAPSPAVNRTHRAFNVNSIYTPAVHHIHSKIRVPQ